MFFEQTENALFVNQLYNTAFNNGFISKFYHNLWNLQIFKRIENQRYNVTTVQFLCIGFQWVEDVTAVSFQMVLLLAKSWRLVTKFNHVCRNEENCMQRKRTFKAISF